MAEPAYETEHYYVKPDRDVDYDIRQIDHTFVMFVPRLLVGEDRALHLAKVIADELEATHPVTRTHVVKPFPSMRLYDVCLDDEDNTPVGRFWTPGDAQDYCDSRNIKASE